MLVEVASRIEKEVVKETSRVLRTPDRISACTASSTRADRVEAADDEALYRLFWDARREDRTPRLVVSFRRRCAHSRDDYAAACCSSVVPSISASAAS